MQFQTVEQLSGVIGLLRESELEEFHLEPAAPQEASVRLLTSRPPEKDASSAGLLRGGALGWIPCCLKIGAVRQVIVREMPDSRPESNALLRWEENPDGAGGVIHLVSAQGLRVEVWVDRIDGILEDLN